MPTAGEYLGTPQLVPGQAGGGLLFYWVTGGGHISLPDGLQLVPLLAGV